MQLHAEGLDVVGAVGTAREVRQIELDPQSANTCAVKASRRALSEGNKHILFGASI